MLGEGNVEFTEQNANGDSPTCATIINGFVSSNVDLILANATASLQAAQAGTNEIPVLGTSVTEYGVALGISDFNGTVGGNISGTSDLAPLDEQAAMIKELFPDKKNVGLLYCSAEPNSVYQVNIVREYLEGQGLTCTDYTFSDSNDLASVTQTACASSDVIYIPTDNTRRLLCLHHPQRGGACRGARHHRRHRHLLRLRRGRPGHRLLRTGPDHRRDGLRNPGRGADPATMEVRSAPTPTKMYNPSICEELGITPPEDYTALES